MKAGLRPGFLSKKLDKRENPVYNVFVMGEKRPNPFLPGWGRAKVHKEVKEMPKLTSKYETIFVVDVTLGEEKMTAVIEKFKDLIAQHGTVENVADWGKRRLAYAINDMTEGYYTLIEFECAPDFIKELTRVYNITEGVMRSIVIAK